ncbi:hypothetical protein COOONC_24756 [Cooperia oncophora]
MKLLFVAYRLEAERETSGINWAKILLLYPRERAFDDGAADTFGNFTRARRGHWLWGCIFGPNDSKTFEEVDREKTEIVDNPPTADGTKQSDSSTKARTPSKSQKSQKSQKKKKPLNAPD